MKTIVISGSHSNIGKTTLAEGILRSLQNWSALKVTNVRSGAGCPRDTDCGVCSGLREDFNIVTDARTINQNGTDTARMKKAGAKKVIWLKSRSRGLRQGLRKALGILKKSETEGVVIEGTSVLKYIRPDIAIYLKDGASRPKPGAKEAQKKADIVILRGLKTVRHSFCGGRIGNGRLSIPPEGRRQGTSGFSPRGSIQLEDRE